MSVTVRSAVEQALQRRNVVQSSSGVVQFLTLPLECSCKPMALMNFQCWSCVRALVRMSATISFVGT